MRDAEVRTVCRRRRAASSGRKEPCAVGLDMHADLRSITWSHRQTHGQHGAIERSGHHTCTQRDSRAREREKAEWLGPRTDDPDDILDLRVHTKGAANATDLSETSLGPSAALAAGCCSCAYLASLPLSIATVMPALPQLVICSTASMRSVASRLLSGAGAGASGGW